MPDGGRLHGAHRPMSRRRECERYHCQGHAGRRLCAGRRRATPAPAFRPTSRQDLRAVLLDQGSRQGHRARAVHGLRHRQADRRLRLCRFRRCTRAPTFRIFLPRHIAGARSSRSRPPRSSAPTNCAADHGARPSRGQSAPRAPISPAQGTILLVEDEEGLRALNARGLTSRGYTRARSRQRRRGDRGAGEITASRSISWSPTW